jgi:hypothetical protein
MAKDLTVETGHNIHRTREGFLFVSDTQDRGFNPRPGLNPYR